MAEPQNPVPQLDPQQKDTDIRAARTFDRGLRADISYDVVKALLGRTLQDGPVEWARLQRLAFLTRTLRNVPLGEDWVDRPQYLHSWSFLNSVRSLIDEGVIRRRASMCTIFIVDVTSGSATISNKNYEAGTDPANKVMTDCDTDGDSCIVHVEVDAGPSGGVGEGWQPVVTIRGGDAAVAITNLTPIVTDTRRFEGSATISVSTGGDNEIYADADDGGRSQNITITRAADPPIVSSATWGQNNGGWSGGEYPTSPDTGLQTAVKSGDTVDIQLTLDSSATRITVESYGASSSTQHFDDSYGAGTYVISGVVCGSASGSQVFRVKANRDGGTYGASDDTPSISMDQNSHSYVTIHNQVFSPADNFALKSGDSCTGDVQITNWSAGNDVITYASSEVTISSPSAYTEGKTYTYLSGTYRDSGTNVTITSRRKANGKQSTHSYLIKICNAAATLSMGGATSRLRSRASGGDKTYSLTMTSNYELKSFACARDAADDGPALGAWSGSAPDKTWTNTITIQEDDTKNTGANSHTWASISAVTGSGLATTTIGTNPDYTVGGFEERDVTLNQFDRYEPIGTMVTNKDNANKYTCEYVGIGEGTYVGNTTPDAGSRKFTVVDSGGNFDADGDYCCCNDPNIYDNLTTYTMRVEELA